MSSLIISTRARRHPLGGDPGLHHAQVLPHQHHRAHRFRHRRRRRTCAANASACRNISRPGRSGRAASCSTSSACMPATSNGSWSAIPTRAMAARPASRAPPGVRVQPDPADHQHGRDAGSRRARRRAALSASSKNLVDRSTVDVSGGDALSVPRSGRRGPPLLRQDRAVSDQSHGGGAALAAAKAIPGSRSISIPLSSPPRRRSRAPASRICNGTSRAGCSMTASSARSPSNDPLAYGFKASRPVLETIAQYVHEQGLCSAASGSTRSSRPARWMCEQRASIVIKCCRSPRFDDGQPRGRDW